MPDVGLSERWRQAAYAANEAAGPSYNAADVHPDAADAAVRVVLEALLDYAGPYRFNQVELDATAVEGLLDELTPRGLSD